MKEIPNIGEVRAALNTLQQFVDGMTEVLGAFDGASNKIIPVGPKPSKLHYTKQSGKSTWKSRISEILTDSDEPLAPRAISDEFLLRHSWKDKRSKLGVRVRSTLAHMKREGLVSNHEGLYSLSKQYSLNSLM